MRWILLIAALGVLAGCSPNHSSLRDARSELPTGNGIPFLDSAPHWGKWTPDPAP
ncbi:MAG: hypothetical protein P4L85_12885 [Paludisphaera borealis]|uniref:hypothetical protein n=1 Tax=Paludisphaera borealis TaxID=1387353 RepID=UPI00284DA8C9|nr:hypothetical protein [Paludisphaera borealis]MDR3620242.1 hypothetical protein [Paludisphaera borealis]